MTSEEKTLQTFQKDIETLKKKVDSFEKDCTKHLKNSKADRDVTKDHYKRSQELVDELQKLQQEVEDHSAEQEPSIKANKFESRKKDLLKKLTQSKDKLQKVIAKIPEDVVKECEKNESKEDEGSGADETDAMKEEGELRDVEDEDGEEDEHDEEEDDEEDLEDEDEEEEEEEEEDEEEDKVAPRVVRRGQGEVEEGDSEGAEEEEDDDEDVDDEEDDDEEYEDEEDEDDDEDEEEEDEDDEEEEEEEEDEEDDVAVQQTSSEKRVKRQYIGVEDFDAEQPGDLSFKTGEILTIISARTDGWLEAVNSQGDKGMVPITYLQEYDKSQDVESEEEDDDTETPRTPKSARNLWGSIRKSVRETSVTDVLHALGAVPAGFRESTLGKLKQQDQHSLKRYLCPKLASSCLSYKDLLVNPATSRVRQLQARIQRIVTLVQVKQMPAAGVGVEVKSRHIRVCLFDGANVLSNIHVIRVSQVDKDAKTWTFNTKATDNMKSIEFGELFVRSNSSDTNIGILFELCMSYTRTKTQQEGEFSCGWVFLKMFDNQGQPVPNKTFEEVINGGTPYEKGVDVDPTVTKKEGTGLLKSLMSGNRKPMLSVRLAAPNKDQKDLLDALPCTLVSSTSYIQYLSFYRQMLCDALLTDTSDIQSTEPVHSPLLKIFPEVAEQPDFMDVLRLGWSTRLKNAKRTEKKDQDSQKHLFRKAFLELIYPLYSSAIIQPIKFGDLEREQERLKEIQRLNKMSQDKREAAASLLSPDAQHKPFDMSELGYTVIGPPCQA